MPLLKRDEVRNVFVTHYDHHSPSIKFGLKMANEALVTSTQSDSLSECDESKNFLPRHDEG